ncbi:hypothetical protein [Paludibaculum fermentans]|uniref:hypothetical protein n=1 Tax=Paludibaculum fermentans TaxID=1473598 RepID=UPI003EBABFC6
MQSDEPAPVMLAGVQVKEEMSMAGAVMVTVPLPPAEVSSWPAREEAIVSEIWTSRETLVPDAGVRTTEATMPLGIVLLFNPASRHVTVPDEVMQDSVLDELEAEGPFTTLSDEKSEAEYERVH